MKLLVSVRSMEEAQAALEGGADLIDIKEPNRGPLGKARDSVIAAIVEVVAGRRPVSAAMGELCDANYLMACAETNTTCTPRRFANGILASYPPPGFADGGQGGAHTIDPKEDNSLHRSSYAIAPSGLDFVKFGLANSAIGPWCDQFLNLRAASCSTVVPTAYADWERSGSPPVGRIAAFVVEHQFPVLLIDTCIKDGCNLLSWLNRDSLEHLVGFLRDSGCGVALAGSLTERDIDVIAAVRPEWIAVRGAVCTNSDRKCRIDVNRVRRFKAALPTSDTRDRG
jgi:uncharacterized protein (UPF0264 family)